MRIPVQIKTDNSPAYVSSKMKHFSTLQYKIITSVSNIPIGQAFVERTN